MSDHVVYENTVDAETYRLVVTGRDDDWYRGRMRVTVVESGEVLLDEEVSISFGAPFGPDAADLEFWHRRTLEVIDTRNEQ